MSSSREATRSIPTAAVHGRIVVCGEPGCDRQVGVQEDDGDVRCPDHAAFDLAALERRHAQATPGPYFVSGFVRPGYALPVVSDKDWDYGIDTLAHFQRPVDAVFYCNAWHDVAALIAEVKQLREAVAMACETPDDHCDCSGCQYAASKMELAPGHCRAEWTPGPDPTPSDEEASNA